MVKTMDFFAVCQDLFQKLMMTAQIIWNFLGGPIMPEIAEFLELSPTTTYLELLFGAVLIMCLIRALMSFFIG